MTPAQAELLSRCRRVIADMEEQVRMMELFLAGKSGGFGTHAEGNRDTTAESIARTRAQITDLQALVEKHDPEGFTKRPEWPSAAG